MGPARCRQRNAGQRRADPSLPRRRLGEAPAANHCGPARQGRTWEEAPWCTDPHAPRRRAVLCRSTSPVGTSKGVVLAATLQGSPRWILKAAFRGVLATSSPEARRQQELRASLFKQRVFVCPEPCPASTARRRRSCAGDSSRSVEGCSGARESAV